LPTVWPSKPIEAVPATAITLPTLLALEKPIGPSIGEPDDTFFLSILNPLPQVQNAMQEKIMTVAQQQVTIISAQASPSSELDIDIPFTEINGGNKHAFFRFLSYLKKHERLNESIGNQFGI
jgi:hypothetical protein